jgi:hypothetical protein
MRLLFDWQWDDWRLSHHWSPRHDEGYWHIGPVVIWYKQKKQSEEGL